MPELPGLKLHVGCGSVLVAGWENIDRSPSTRLARFPRLRRALRSAGVLTAEQARGLPRGIVNADVSKRIPYPDGSVSCVYSSHMIEHMSRPQALAFVRECNRVLAPDGVVRTATPDLAFLTKAYLAGALPDRYGTIPADAFMTALGTYYDVEANRVKRLISRFASGSWHQWLYDEESLSRLMVEGGLLAPHRCNYREGAVPDLDQLELRPDSLFIEARR